VHLVKNLGAPCVKKKNMNTIIDTISIWTTAQKLKTSGRGRSASNQSLHGINKLRGLILELAVRGKLLPQNSDDEPAIKLLKKITKEKLRLISDGKIKKQEPLSEITDDEKPFELPEKWIWTRLGNLSANVHYGYTASANPQIKDVRLLRITDIQDDSVNWESVPGCEIDKKNVADYLLENGDILIARTGGTIGKSYLVSNINLCAVFASYLIRVRRINEMYPLFIKTYLGSQLYWKQLYENSMGTGQPNVNGNALKNLMFPLPPLAEQHRIVAKVDELMVLCDQLEQQQTDSNSAHEILVETLLDTLTNAPNQAELETAWQRISSHFETLFTTEHSIDRLKQTILQLAVMGKLVPQNPDDEPAIVLLKKIAKEKARLVKEGKIKKQNLLLEIGEDEIPFEIPKSWIWTKLGIALKKITDGTHFSPPNGENGEFLYISAKNIKTEGVLLSNATYITKDVHDEIYARCDPEFGDILYIKDGATTGITTINNLKEPFSMLSSVALLKVPEGILNKYLLLSLNSPYFYKEMRSEMTGVAITRVTLNKLNDAIITLPPLAEQHRIVTKVDELFAICDALKERINESQVTQLNLADTLVDGAVG